jgi:pyruvate, water dikinase
VITKLNVFDDTNRLGGKAKGLQTAMKLGLTVPPTLAIELPEFSKGADEAIDHWLEDTAESVSTWAVSKQIGHLVIRSSGQSEDSDGTSFAGLFPSRFSLASKPAVQTALREMLHGLSSKGLSAYIQAKGIRREQGMSFLVQPTVPPLRSGVAFAVAQCNVVDLAVQCTWGLALDLVRGVATGDTYDSRRSADSALTIGAKSLAVYPLVRSDKVMPGNHVQVRLAPDGTSINAKLVFVDEPQALAYVRMPSAESRGLALSSEILTFLRTQLTHAVDKLAVSLDVEWVQAIDGRIYTVQMRPVTAQLLAPDDPQPCNSDRTEVFTGEPGAPGRFTGHIRHRGDDGLSFSTVRDGVLVCGAAKPEMLPEILHSGALVSSDAGILSHVAILARELGKPCVLGASSLPPWAKDGTVAAVDGAAGTVIRVTQAGSATHLEERLDHLLDEVEIELWPDRLPGHSREEDPGKRTVIVLLTPEWLEALQKDESLQLRLLQRKAILIFHECSTDKESVGPMLRALGFTTAEWRPWSVAVSGISIESATDLLASLGLRSGS